MTVEEISKHAQKGIEPGGLSVADTILFCRLKDIYSDFKLGKITKEQGEARKAKALLEYADNRKSVEQHINYVLRVGNMWKEIETAAIAYAKSETHTPEADALMEAIYGVKLKEVV